MYFLPAAVWLYLLGATTIICGALAMRIWRSVLPVTFKSSFVLGLFLLAAGVSLLALSMGYQNGFAL